MMALMSSPVAYPPSSSPAPPLETRKRPLPNEILRPAKKWRSETGWSKTGKANSHRLGEPNSHLVEAREENCGPHNGGTTCREAENEASLAVELPRLGRSVFRKHWQAKVDTEGTPLPVPLERSSATLPSLKNLESQNPPSIEQELNSHNINNSDQNLYRLRTTSGKVFSVRNKNVQTPVTYEQLIASRSATHSGRAQKSYYGVNIHHLLDQAANGNRQERNVTEPFDVPQPSVEHPKLTKNGRNSGSMLWTEKYRARKFTDLVGDERTHRTVLRWLKGWDPIVFSGSGRSKQKVKASEEGSDERAHRKIMLLTGPPGLGKTTLAHVCAKQAGYEVVEINASDERSKDVVKGRIRDIVGTENVKGVNTRSDAGTVRKAGRPVCVVVDEVDGVVGGSAGGEGGFIKALMDLVTLDSKNSSTMGPSSGGTFTKRQKQGDRFRLLRPMILICNDLYHPSLRPLRTSSMAEIIQIRRPPLDKVVARLRSVFEKEGVACDGDGVRRLCEASWGISNRRENRSGSSNTGEGDMRGILVVGQWVAVKLKTMEASSAISTARLTRTWVEKNMLENLSHGGGSARGIGRGGAKEVVERVFQEGAGFPKLAASDVDVKGSLGDSAGVSEAGKQRSIDRLREIADMSGESDRIMTDCFAAYPSRPFQDDTYLTKPNAAYEWLHFHDCLSLKVHSGQEWELSGYLSQPTLGFHHLFASPAKHYPADRQKRWDEDIQEEPLLFSGPRADYEASEVLKQNRAVLQGIQSSLSISLFRSFKSLEDISIDLVPHLNRLLTPNIKPIVVGGSGEQKGMVSVRKDTEKVMLERAVNVMGAIGVNFERNRVEEAFGGTASYVYRMEP